MLKAHSIQHRLHCGGFVLITLAAWTAVSQAEMYHGTLSWNTGLVASGDWANSATSLTWNVDNSNGYWHYNYVLTVPSNSGAISHIIFEVSPNFGVSDVLRNGTSWPIYVEDYEGNGNPGVPSEFHGLKFDETSGTTLTIDFDSWRMPVWGDFYSKDGKASTGAWNYVYNVGFTSPDWDPTVGAHNGPEQGHLLVPDTVVPLPGAVLLGLLGMSVAGLRLRRYA